MSVAMKPGARVATEMPSGARARAIDCPKACSPALLAPYAGTSGSPRYAPREPTLTMRPRGSPAAGGTAIMCRATHQVRFAAPIRLVARVVCQARTQAS
jgi:hypothetical protein